MQAEPEAPLKQEQDKSSQTRLPHLTSVRALSVIAFLVGATVIIAHRPLSHREAGDPSIYDYIAQSIVRGQMPYRDVIDPKTPLSMYLSAAAIGAGKTVGLRDIIAIRLLQVLLMGALAMVTFLVAESYFRNRAAAVLASLIMLVTDSFSIFMISGTQPKLPMMLFGMTTLLLIAKDKPLLAGACSTMSFLCWQPGLMFTGVALLIFSRYLTSWRDLRAAKVILGATVPLAVLAVYFYFRGALGELWAWTIVYPYTVFAPESAVSFKQAIINFLRVSRSTFGWDLIFVLMAVAGFITYAASRIAPRIKKSEGLKSENLFRDAVIYPPLIYLVFCLISFQGGPDLIPFFPFIGVFAAWLLIELDRVLAIDRARWKTTATLVAIAAVALLILVRGASYRTGRRTLQAQDQEIQTLAAYLGPEDKIYLHGSAEILVLLARPNLNKYIAFDTGADNFLAAEKPGGFEELLNEIELERPKLVALTRLRNVRHRKELKEWAEQYYDKLHLGRLKGVYLRKSQ